MKSKLWFESKTIWFNIIMTILDIIALNSTMQFLNPGVTAFIQGIGNIILRVWFTNTQVEKTLL